MGTNNRPANPTDRAQADLRKSVRYALHVPVTFSWVDEGGVRQEGKGRTRDISPGGTFVLALPCPPVGAAVGLNIIPSMDPQAPTLEIKAEARVLRVELTGQGEETSGFAVRNQKVLILRGSAVIDEWTPVMRARARKKGSDGAEEALGGEEED